MPISPGDKIGAYDILGALGKGGMGEVYRARDAKLNRDVAIKVLTPALANDTDYRTRFEREAQVLASLNHPNIAAIYGLEGDAIVMELVDGETLRTPLPLAEALPIARQIAEALEAAHEKGIIHRDLKPGNVKVTTDGLVKVLDFGLAKAVEKAAKASSANSPTLTMRSTEAGVILGTAAYMSPEQAVGKAVDRRADIWAFGVVLYELLTGQRLFDGETVSDTLADVLRKEIDLSNLPIDTSPAIRELLRRCLDRNLKNRLRDIGEARIAIENSGSPSVAAKPSSSRWPWVAAVLTLALATLAFVHFSESAPEPPLRSFSFTPKALLATRFIRRAAISPDGRHVAYVAENKLGVRTLDSEQDRALEGTNGAEGPFWSPDSTHIGFAASGELKKVSLSGGSSFILAKLGGEFRGGAWSPDGRTIVVSIAGLGLVEVPSGGGVLKVVAQETGGSYYSPFFLPSSGRNRLVVVGRPTVSSQTLQLIDLDTGRNETLRRPGAFPAWSPDGYLVYQTDVDTPGAWALKLSPTTGKVQGDPMPVLNAGSDFSASADGTLLWVDSAVPLSRRLIWRDRSGKKLADTGLPTANFISVVDLSPDGTQVAYSVAEQGKGDIWIADLTRGVRTRLTFSPERDWFPSWSPSGQEIAFASENHEGNFGVFLQAASGGSEPRPVVVSSLQDYPSGWSPDGTTLLFGRQDPKTGFDLWTVKRKADGTFEPPAVWLQTPFNEVRAVFSPDGRHVAYSSNESGRLEVYVRPSGGAGGRWQVSAQGGHHARWSLGGREIIYQSNESLMAAPVSIEDRGVRPGVPMQMFRTRAVQPLFRSWDVHPDGKRFLIAEPEETEAKPPSIHVIQNWRALLRQKSLQ